MLEAEGLVTLVANTGAWVSTLGAEECQELYLVRERLEPLLLKMHVPLVTDDEIARLQALADRMEESADVEEFLVLARELQLLWIDPSAPSVLPALVTCLCTRTQNSSLSTTPPF